MCIQILYLSLRCYHGVLGKGPSFQLMVVGEVDNPGERNEPDPCFIPYLKLETIQVPHKSRMDKCIVVYAPNGMTHHQENA